MIIPVDFKLGSKTLTAMVYHELPEYETGYRGETFIEEIEGLNPKAEQKIILKYGGVIIEKSLKKIKYQGKLT